MTLEPEGRWYSSQRLKLRYWVWGDGSKPPLLLIHGTRDHARSLDRIARALADRYTIYAPDLRGHGDSDWAIGGTYSHIDYVLDIHALGEELGGGPFTLIGHSLGGGIALQYAGTFPEKVDRIITIEGLGRTWAEAPKPASQRMRDWIGQMRNLEARTLHTYPSIEAATERMHEANRFLTPEMARHLTEHGVRQADDGGYTWKFDNFTRAGSPYSFNMEDARDIWNQIRCPILIIWGEESWAKGHITSNLLNAFHNYRVITVAEAGHWVHHDQFETFIAHANTFLNATEE